MKPWNYDQTVSFQTTTHFSQDEKHFVEQLQQKLRQSVRSLKAMVPLVSLGDPDLEAGKELVGFVSFSIEIW